MSTQDNDVAEWWRTSIIDMEPGRIEIRGRAIQDLIGRLSFPQMIWFTATGHELTVDQANLFEAALVAAVDHGPQAPSIAIARMAMTCGVGINNAMASGLNVLGDVHGGAGEQAVELYSSIAEANNGEDIPRTVADQVAVWQRERSRFIPGFGHRFHKPTDPRAPRLLELVDAAAADGYVSGQFAEIGRAVEIHLADQRGKSVPMNIDGATAVIFAELGCPPKLARGFFCLSRGVGILAHAWEQSQQGGRNKGPTPPDYRWTYDGPAD